MGLKDLLEGWVLKIAVKKGAKVLVGVMASAKVLQEAGFSVDAMKLETWLMGVGSAAVAVVLNYLKVKTRLGAKFL